MGEFNEFRCLKSTLHDFLILWFFCYALLLISMLCVLLGGELSELI